jgi:hypothetical protein
VSAGDTVEFVGVGEDYISWEGGRQDDGRIRLGLSYTNVGAAVKPGTPVAECFVWGGGGALVQGSGRAGGSAPQLAGTPGGGGQDSMRIRPGLSCTNLDASLSSSPARRGCRLVVATPVDFTAAASCIV